MMFTPAMDNVLSAMYAPNDKLGVELMGATRWNGLKRAVSALSANAVKNVAGKSDAAIYAAARNALNRANRARNFNRRPVTVAGDPLCAELLGANEAFCNELLGFSWGETWTNIKNATHNILEKGENIPVADAAVDRIRGIFDVINNGTSAASTAASLYENRYKILLGGLGIGVLIYFLVRNK